MIVHASLPCFISLFWFQQVPNWYVSAEAGRRAVLQSLCLLEQEQVIPVLRIEGRGLRSRNRNRNLSSVKQCVWAILSRHKLHTRYLKIKLSWTVGMFELMVFIDKSTSSSMFMLAMCQGLCCSKWRRRSCNKCHLAAQDTSYWIRTSLDIEYPLTSCGISDLASKEIRVLHALGAILSIPDEFSWELMESCGIIETSSRNIMKYLESDLMLFIEANIPELFDS